MKLSLSITDVALGAINRVMSLLSDALRSVPRMKHITTLTPSGAPIYTSSVAGDPVFVKHAWGTVPTSFIATSYGDTRIYATAEDRAKWDANTIVVRGSAASVRIELTLIAHEDA